MEKEKEKVYNLRITESEIKNTPLKNSLINVIALRLRMQKNKPHYTISEAECFFLSKHYSWVDVIRYAPKKKDQLRREVGKYQGKRCVIRGRR